ncbi:Arm DNA-binding domain-containing protein [Bacteroides xylanisolvens]|nr:Arm DNA-binding domain-containing protein [Bacteroides xylanisolvens]
MGRKKKEIKLKEPVRIREKNLLDGSISLYLDIYYRGNRKKEGLKLYLVPEINAATKLQNANTRKLAEQIKAQRILDIQKEGLVDWDKVKKSRLTLSAWFGQYVEDNAELSESSKRSKRNVQARVEQYLSHIGKPDLSLKEVDKEF